MLPTFDFKIDFERLKEQPVLPEILAILKIVRPDWLPEQIRYKVMTGGISNHLYGYYLDGQFDVDVVLFRIEEEASNLMVDRKQERDQMQVLYAAGIGPPLYAVYKNGMAYGYIHGESLTIDTVRDEKIRKLIAKEMVRLHAVRPPGSDPTTIWLKDLSFNLVELVPDGFPDNPDKHKRFTELVRPKSELRKELEQLWVHLEALNSPVVFCHNDLLPENIIYNRDQGTVHFIDYEFAMFTYEHQEISGHFIEYTGTFPLDLSKYPDKSYQLDWIKYYLECKAEQNGRSSLDVTQMEIEECYVKVNKFALASNLTAGLWGLVQAKYSTLGFDYLGYGAKKVNEYFSRKEEFLSLELPE